ncbi:MAG: S-layer homology domain-containing protein, partial [Natronincolaceae bacterium]
VLNTVLVDEEETDEETPLPKVPGMEVEKSGEYLGDPERAEVGDKIHYIITVTNTGNTTLAGIPVVDTKIGLNATITELAPDAVWTHIADYSITQADIDAGSVLNTVLVDEEGTDEETPLPKVPGMEVEKSGEYLGDPERAEVGDKIHYTITVTNTGNTTLTNIAVADNMIGLGTIITELLPGAVWTHEADYSITQADIDAGKVLNTVLVGGEGTTEEVELPKILEEPAVSVTKRANRTAYIRAGQEITYTITIRNTGNVPLTGITASDPLIRLYGPEGDNGNEILDVGETWTYTGTYRVVQADIREGRIVNTVTVETNETEPFTATEIVRYDRPEPDPRPDRDDEIVIIEDEEIPAGLPELNKEDHYRYIQGYPDNTVRPEGLITREEVAAVFYRLLTENYRNIIWTLEHKFPDVESTRWSTKHIATLTNGEIITGYPDGTFKPGEFITRAELATIASRFDNLSPFEADGFSDIAGHWANKFINSAAKKGWVKGYPDGTFKPDRHITRAEFVTLVNAVLERKVHKKDILPEARQFPDLPEDKWYYEEMQEAINSHIYNRKEDTYEEWLKIIYPILDM